MYVGAVVHHRMNGECVPRIIESVTWYQTDDADLSKRENTLGEVMLLRSAVEHAVSSQHSEDAHYEGTWHIAESCSTEENFVAKPPKLSARQSG